MRLAVALALAAALLGPGAFAEEEPINEHEEIFKVLDKPAEGDKEGTTLNDAVGTFDRALGKYRSGETKVVNSNLGYNQKKLKELQKQAEAQRKYLNTLWERVAVHFEDLKAEYGGDTKSPAYRKAALVLQEEYDQRAAEAQQKLAEIEADITRVRLRLSALGQRKKLNELQNDLRNTDLGPHSSGPNLPEREPLPSRADKAFEVLNDLSARKVDKRVGLLVGSAAVRSAADQYFDRQIAEMLKPNRK